MQSFIKLLAFCLIMPSMLPAQTWEEAAALPGAPRHHPVTISIDGYGYLVTGSNNEQDFYRYDPEADTWEQLTDFPGEGRGFAYGVAYDGKGYLGFGSKSGVRYKDLWEYDPLTEVWTELDSLPGVGRAHPALIAGSGKIWMGLGSGPNGNLDDWWEYDIATNTWEQQPNFPSFPRHHPYYFDIDGEPYVGFGHGAGIYNDFYRFDFENDAWITLSPFPDQGRVAGTQFSYGGKGYILSGQGEDHDDLPEGEFWEYDPATDTWIELVPHPGGGRWAPGSFVLGGEVFLLCGNQEVAGNRNDMWRANLPAVTSTSKELRRNAEIKISPNPARDYIELQSDLDLPAGTTVSVVSLAGEILMTWDYDGGRVFDVGRLVGGVYVLKVLGDTSFITKRFIIAK